VEAKGLVLLRVIQMDIAPSWVGAVVHRKGLQSQECILNPAVFDKCTQVRTLECFGFQRTSNIISMVVLDIIAEIFPMFRDVK